MLFKYENTTVEILNPK